MLLSVTGASGAGKSSVLSRIAGADWGGPVRCVEFDSIGVPHGADTVWRHGAVEWWVRRAVEAQARGEHLLLCGQVPVGELLAAPSTDRLDGVAVCLLDCSPDVRAARLRARGEPEESLVHHIAFGEWFRAHAHDLDHAPEVVRIDSATPMRWGRWRDWDVDGLRRLVEIVDTDPLTVAQVAHRVEAWARRSLGELPHG